MNFQIVDNNAEKALAKLNADLDRALEIIGGMAEGYAKEACRVDTGLLRNSITHGISGSALSKTYTNDPGTVSGEYSGNFPRPNGQIKTVIVGSNVEYAPYVESGTVEPRRSPHPFLRPAFSDHLDEYKEVLKTELGL